ncbi:S41 family peptidase [uncultured Kriegella sp.]|uniref:S41 family peptidase n=1 Tax=uncultured Kriegella sp. TaxID=1798910 RepID=UPI0030DCCAE4|tara:strand:+ start:380366 stop:382615 length:2250 start_codon:yes stop_codon:yes gene_type:complete
MRFKIGYILLLLFISCSEKNNSYDRQQKIENLKAFASVYGYVKYFHPSDGVSEIDWTAFAIYGANLVEKCESKKELTNTFNTLFKPIAPSINFSTTKSDKYNLTTITPKNLEGFKPTFWQHSGVAIGMDPQLETPYQSSRVNGTINKDYSFVVSKLTMSLDATKYIGKKMKYVAWAKKDDVHTEKGYLRFVLKNSDGSSELKRASISQNQWKQYEIITDIDSATTSIQLGIALSGKGAVRYDLPQLFYENNGNWVEVPLSNQDFETETSFKDPKPNQWYFEGVGYSCSLTTTDPHNGIQSVILEYSGVIEKEKGQQLFSHQPQFGELIEKELANGIFFQAPLVLYSDGNGTYPKSDSDSLSELKNSLQAVEQKAIDLPIRLGNIINTYNVFQHFYPYFDVVDVDWSQELQKALSRSFSDATAKDHLVTLEKFTAPLKDGHINVSYYKSSDWSTPPITWEWIEDKLVITNVLDSKIPLKVGDIVTSIDGINAVTYFEEINSRISAGTKGWLNHKAEQLSLLGEKDAELTITVNDQDIKLIRNSYPYSSPTRMADYEKINDSVYYLNLNSIAMEDIEKLIPELTKAKSIICDLRVYPKGNHGFISYLLKENDTVSSWMKIPQSIYPDREKISYQNGNWMLPSKKPYLGDKQIIFITKGSAMSYAESYMGYIRGYNLGTIIGQPTAGTNGNINLLQLSEGFSIRWTGMKVEKHDGSQLHGIGFLPDIYVKKTIEGIKSGKDEFLEKAIELTE